MGVTIEEVAARANVNKSSVSRILNGKADSYSDQTKQRVLQAASEMGYQPNVLARALWTGSTQIVSLWLLAHESYSPYFGYVHHYLQRYGIQQGYQMITEDVPFALAKETDYSQLTRWPVDGILACDLTHVAAQYVHSKMGRRCPLVFLGQGFASDQERLPDTDYVILDLYAGAREATQHLLQAGCQRIAFVGQPRAFTHDPLGEPRNHAYTDLMKDARKPTEYIAVAEDSRQGGYEALKAYIENNSVPDGLFCVNDEIAIGCYMALHEAGIGVPDDVLLVGFDGLDNARLFPCPITSVVIPVEQMCKLSWEMLLKRMKNPEAPLQHETLTPRLEIRASSRR